MTHTTGSSLSPEIDSSSRCAAPSSPFSSSTPPSPASWDRSRGRVASSGSARGTLSSLVSLSIRRTPWAWIRCRAGCVSRSLGLPSPSRLCMASGSTCTPASRQASIRPRCNTTDEFRARYMWKYCYSSIQRGCSRAQVAVVSLHHGSTRPWFGCVGSSCMILSSRCHTIIT